MDQPMMGERPDLPIAVIRELHQRYYHHREALSDWAWQRMADGAVAVFESYRKLT
jgi:hypothetical protein